MSRKHKKALYRIILSAVLFLIASLLPFKELARFLIFLIPYLVIGYDVVCSAVKKTFRGQLFDEQFLMTVATIGAFATGEYPEGVAVMLFYQIGELFQGIAVGKSRRSIAELMDIKPETAIVYRDGAELEVEPEEVAVGEIIIIRPGERIALDGIITEGASSVNTSALTGESLPQDVDIGDRVISGTVNLSGVIKVSVEKVYEDSTVAKILELVEDSSDKKAKIEGFITRFSRYYTPIVVISALLLAFIPPIFTEFSSFTVWLNRALIFLVVSCPCALVISVPLSFFCGIGGASREGILIKGANHLEMLSRADCMVFDKTGTLTEGKFEVVKINASHIEESELLSLAAHAEHYSSHPIARSIVAAYGRDIDKKRVGEINELAGKGIKAVIDDQMYFIGNSELMKETGIDLVNSSDIGTVVHISSENEYLGSIIVGDSVKKDAKKAISDLKNVGVFHTVMLTGDSEVSAQAVASQLTVNEYYAELLPAQKIEQVERLISQGRSVVFVGDGINDAPVLTRADVGIAMGALGSDAAIESADIVLMDDKPSKIPLAVKISKKTMSIVKQNIIFALGIKGLILLLSAFGLTNMWIAVFGDVGVMVIAILNAMRAIKRQA